MFCLLVANGSLAWGQSAQIQNQLPNIGNPADRFLSPAIEAKVGADFLRNIRRRGLILEDPEVSVYIQHLGNTLTNSLADGSGKYTFFVVNDAAINAFAVPGGYIGMNAGLILASKNENEVAGVMAHEIAHVSQRHIARRIAAMNETRVPTLGALLAGFALAASGSGDAGTALVLAGTAAQQQQLLNFSRIHEIEADRIGIQILYAAGFDPEGMASFFKIMQRNRYGAIPEEFGYLLTHPLDNVRISEAQNRIDKLPKRKKPSSLEYTTAKARLAALLSSNPKQDLQVLKKKLEKNNSTIIRYTYSQLLERNLAFDEAANVALRLTQEDPENIAYQLAYARALQGAGKNDAAQKTLDKMLQIYPGSFAINYQYAKLMNETNQAKAGRNRLKRFLQKNHSPLNSTYKLLAELYAKTGNNIESSKTLADYYFNAGNFNAAVFQLEQILNNPKTDMITRSQIEQRLQEILKITRS